MEDVLDLYAEPLDAKRPVVCVDELPYQLLSDVREPIPARPGRVEKVDYEYRREGSCTVFLAFEPRAGWRQVEVRARRTALDFAHFMKGVAERYADAEVIRVVLDNLNTHSPAAFYQAFDPVDARRLTERFEFHFTPVHGSWLNQAEIEFSVLGRQCLRRRLGSVARVAKELVPWQADRNARGVTTRWLFTSEDARVRLARLYPDIDS